MIEAIWDQWMVVLIMLLGTSLGILNGINDVSGMRGTVCSSRALRLLQAQCLAMVGIWLSALGGSLGWGMLARRFSIPSSATHSFIGAICGATLLGTLNFSAVSWTTGVSKVFIGLIMSPLLGGTLGYVAFRALPHSRVACRSFASRPTRLPCSAVSAYAPWRARSARPGNFPNNL
ncbi:inorganic phosphate transporter [bacterium]|nr:inorganic phosphate transporter [bacterium]